jgi:hypothetical protein
VMQIVPLRGKIDVCSLKLRCGHFPVMFRIN